MSLGSIIDRTQARAGSRGPESKKGCVGNDGGSRRSAMAEESLRMVIFKRFHPAGTPGEKKEREE